MARQQKAAWNVEFFDKDFGFYRIFAIEASTAGDAILIAYAMLRPERKDNLDPDIQPYSERRVSGMPTTREEVLNNQKHIVATKEQASCPTTSITSGSRG